MHTAQWQTGWRGTMVRTVAAGLAAALMGVLSLPPAAAQEPTEKLPSAEEILDKAVESMGGRAAFERLQNRVSKGRFEVPAQNMKGTLISYEAPPLRSYTVIDIPPVGKVESGSDGTVFWEMSAMQGARILDGDEKAMKARDARFNAQLHWRELYPKVECVGRETVDDIPCYKVVMTPAAGAPQTAFYAVKNCLPLKVLMTIKTPMGELPVEVRLEDYKTVDGVLLHHKVVQRMMGMEQVVIIESIEHNVDLPADRFALPEPVKALLEKPKTQPTTTRPAQP